MELALVEGDVQARGRLAVHSGGGDLNPPPFGGVVLGIDVDVLAVVRNLLANMVGTTEEAYCYFLVTLFSG